MGTGFRGGFRLPDHAVILLLYLAVLAARLPAWRVTLFSRAQDFHIDKDVHRTSVRRELEGALFMRDLSRFLCGIAGAAMMAFSAAAAGALTCDGTCGVLGADGDIAASPLGGVYDWVSTDGAPDGVGSIKGIGGNNGSTSTASLFSAIAGSTVKFFANFVTTDGSGFTDYAWVELRDAASVHVAWLFTARTNDTGNTVPGGLLPAVDAALSPASTAITPTAPVWAPLGADSGDCYLSVGNGCGFTGWIESTYVISDPGSYQLVFGVSNLTDRFHNSGLAFDGIDLAAPALSAVPVPTPLVLFLTALGGIGMLGRLRNRKSRKRPA
jgi:hypothetical protein